MPDVGIAVILVYQALEDLEVRCFSSTQSTGEGMQAYEHLLETKE
jgi:hypothetical protein